MKRDGHKNALCKRLFDMQLKMNLTQKELAAYLGVAETTIHSMYWYNKNLKSSMIQKIQHVFDVDITRDDYLEQTAEDLLHKQEQYKRDKELTQLRKQFVMTLMFFKKWGIKELSLAIGIPYSQVRYLLTNENARMSYNFIKKFHNHIGVNLT